MFILLAIHGNGNAVADNNYSTKHCRCDGETHKSSSLVSQIRKQKTLIFIQGVYGGFMARRPWAFCSHDKRHDPKWVIYAPVLCTSQQITKKKSNRKRAKLRRIEELKNPVHYDTSEKAQPLSG